QSHSKLFKTGRSSSATLVCECPQKKAARAVQFGCASQSVPQTQKTNDRGRQPIKLRGTVKSYNPDREYSFIIPDIGGSISLEQPHTLHFTTRSLTRLYSTVSKRLVSQSPHR